MNLTKTAQPTIELEGESIQIGGGCSGDHFPLRRWREAILTYLFAIWSGEQGLRRLIHRPKLIIQGVTLRLDFETQQYFAYGGTGRDALGEYRGGEVLLVGPGKAEVEVGLARLVKDNDICAMQIRWPTSWVWFGKTSRRGELIVGDCGIPETWRGLGAGR